MLSSQILMERYIYLSLILEQTCKLEIPSLSLQEFNTINTLKLVSFTDAAEVAVKFRVDFFNSNKSRDPIYFKKSRNFLSDAEKSPLDTQECRRGSNMSCGAIDS